MSITRTLVKFLTGSAIALAAFLVVFTTAPGTASASETSSCDDMHWVLPCTTP
ncbi:hypothetical protein [Actinocrispum wychmicini]|uniref:Uncharacterized protein n=1 Tax=Actinocrispum wychmicini TaxID=1213861 RepID=A0A4R2JQ60_9PSEU|nr:hypothetical protein [Actinocrispum wychmicini]TCO62351.1 hypothetical protein EV192_102488 [Actinocrispum wychmicini]